MGIGLNQGDIKTKVYACPILVDLFSKLNV
nr:MAG TPA: hypothetical protein [Inoviridae sp.]